MAESKTTSGASNPILHRLGDLEPGERVEVKVGGKTYCGTIAKWQPDSGNVRVWLSDDHGVAAPSDRPCHRLLPETPATKHAEEMLDEVRLACEAFRRLRECDPVPLRGMEVNYISHDGAMRKLSALLSRIDAEGGAA